MIEQKFSNLTSNLEAMLYESMEKIGYCKGESIRIYYTPELLFHLLGATNLTPKDIEELLKEFSEENKELWGELLCKNEHGRYKIEVSSKGVDYVYEKNKENHFLRDLIQVLREPNTTIDKVMEVFHQYSNDVICEKSKDEEFEYAVSFQDKTIDGFIYCFTFDELGQYYHRFTEFDFQKLIEENQH